MPYRSQDDPHQIGHVQDGALRRDRSRRRTYLIQNPYDIDAMQFVRTIFNQYGLRPVCLYDNPKARYYGEREYPELASPLVEAAIDIVGMTPAEVVAEVSQHYDVVTALPWAEQYIEFSAAVNDLLGVDWNPSEVLLRFRDKFAQKRYVARVAPDVRVPACRLVRSIADLQDGLPERFVLKPNDGSGNRSIGIFGRDQFAQACAHVESGPGVVWVLEEFVGGTEYHIDGHVREAGDVVCLGAWEYLRTDIKGYSTVYSGEIQVGRDEPVFAQLVDYAERLLTATGLRRCPFHLEVKVDERGPCVIDLGARFASDGGAVQLSRLHPCRPDAFAVAVSDYLGGALRTDDLPLDWTEYDRARTVMVYGTSSEEGLVGAVEGIDEVESLPEFVLWAPKPRVGDPVRVTRELRDMTYLAHLSCEGDRDDALALIDHVRSTVTVRVADGAGQRLTAKGRRAARQIVPKLAWINHRVGQTATRRVSGTTANGTIGHGAPGRDSPADVVSIAGAPADLSGIDQPLANRSG